MRHKHLWIGLAGFAEAGKSTVAAYLEKRHDYIRLHVKNFLAEAVHPLLIRYGVPDEELFDYTHGSKINDPLPGNPNLTARRLLQVQGGELLDATDPDMMSKFWCDEAKDGPYVNESIRYARECAYYRGRGMFVIRITRPGHQPLRGTHMSEADQTFPVDAEIVNDGTLEELHAKVDELLAPTTQPFVAVIINGPPRSGKDTLVKMLKGATDATVANISSIDGVREILRKAGVDIYKKTPEQRKMLANLGDFLEDECAFKTNYVVNEALAARADAYRHAPVYAFIHVREKDMMEKITAQLSSLGVSVRSLFVDRTTGEAAAVKNDDVRYTDWDYDWIVHNDGDLNQLSNAVRALHLEGLLKGERRVAFTSEFARYSFSYIHQTIG